MCTRPWCALAGPAAKRAHNLYCSALSFIAIGILCSKSRHTKSAASPAATTEMAAAATPVQCNLLLSRLSDCLKDSLSDKICTCCFCTYTPFPVRLSQGLRPCLTVRRVAKSKKKREENAQGVLACHHLILFTLLSFNLTVSLRSSIPTI